MTIDIVPAALSGLLALGLVWFVARHSVSGHRARAENADARAAALEEQSLRFRAKEMSDASALAKLQAQVDAQVQQLAESRRGAETERERNEALSRALSDSRIQAEAERRTMRERTILLEQVQDRAAALEMSLHTAEQAGQDLMQELHTLREHKRMIQDRLDAQQSWVNEQGQALRTQFGELAARLLAEKAGALQQSNNSAIDDIIAPLRHQLAEFQARVNEVHDVDARDRAGLSQLLDGIGRTQQKLSGHTEALSRSLAAAPGTAGALAGMRLELQLQAAGFEEGRHYLPPAGDQTPLAIRLPDQTGYLPIDAGLDLSAWDAARATGDDTERSAALDRHLDAVRGHIDALGARRYADLAEGEKALPFTLLYLPVESAAGAALDRDAGLLARAHRNQVVLATPGTLFMVVGMVAQLWRVAAQEMHARTVAAEGEQLLHKLEEFVDNFGRVGTALDGARALFADADARLRSGDGNVLAAASRMKLLRGAGAEVPQLPETDLASAAPPPMESGMAIS